MRLRPRAFREEPEINFIPLIDVLLVILIFLMVTTTYSRYAELQINLPTAEAERQPERADQIDVARRRPGQLLRQQEGRRRVTARRRSRQEMRRRRGHEGSRSWSSAPTPARRTSP